jgi:hypothetical protein
MMKWRWREGVERDANPNVLRVCWTFLIHIFLHQLRKQLSRIYTSKPRRNLQIFGWCLQFKQLHLWDSNVLLLHAKTSRETFAIGINLLRKRVSEKFSIICPFWIRRKPLQFWSPDIVAKKRQPLVNLKKDRKMAGKKSKVRAHPLKMQMYNTGGGGGFVWREKGEGGGGRRLLYTPSLHEPCDM